eukprot:UN03731
MKNFQDYALPKITDLSFRFDKIHKNLIRSGFEDMIISFQTNNLPKFQHCIQSLDDLHIKEGKTTDYLNIFYDVNSNLSLMHIAAGYGMNKFLLYFMKTKNIHPDIHGKNGITPLYYAVRYNKPKTVKLLLSHKASPNPVISSTKEIPLIFVACKVKQTNYEILRLLVKGNIDLTQKDHENCTPLIRSIIDKNYDYAIFMLKP